MTAQKALEQIALTDYVVSQAEMLIADNSPEHIFELKKEHESLGYISLYDLKMICTKDAEQLQDCQIRNMDSAEWTSLFEHPYFQRRKPQLVPTSDLQQEDDTTYYLLRMGQKCGPYEKHELSTMLEEKEILLTDMVSTNAGHSWMKLYQVDGFDRRTLKSSDQLPGLPFDGVFEKISTSPYSPDPETDALSGLAYLGNVKRGKVIERERSQHFEEEMTKKTGGGSIYKYLLALSVVGIGYFLYNIKGQLNSPLEPGKSPVGEQAEMLTPVESFSGNTMIGEKPSPDMQPVNQFNQGRRSGKFESRTLEPIRPNQRKSFMESNKYMEIKNSDTPEDDANYFYENTAPMELDPVRTQVSKETYEGPVGEPAPLEGGDPLFEEEISR